MQDREMVAAIVAGQPEGLAAAYDRHAPGLYAYCRSLLGEPADAADAVQDTFIVAASKLAGLRDPDRFRPWLYAVARNECMRKLRARAHAAPLEEAGEVSDGSGGAGEAAERADLRALVGAALAGLNAGDREVIELTLRQELEGADLADALGVSRNQAHALASRARSQFETSLGALLVARAGRQACPELDSILAGWDGRLTVLLRKRVNRHIDRCETCGERKRSELSPAMLLSLLPVAVLPNGLRETILHLVADASPAAAAHRDRVSRRAAPFRDSGFPVPLDPPRLPHGPGYYALAAAAAFAALAMLGGGAAVAADLLGHPAPTAASSPAPSSTARTAGPPAAPSSPAATTAAPSPSATRPPATTPATASPPPPPAPSPAASPSPTPKPTPKPSPKPSPSPSPSPSPGQLIASPATVTLEPPPAGGPATGTFTLTAQGGPIKAFDITIPTASAPYLTAAPVTGSLKSGQSVTVTMTVTNPRLPYQTVLTIDPGGETVTVLYPPSG